MSKQQLVIVWSYFVITLCFAQYGVAQNQDHILSGEYNLTLFLGYGAKSETDFSAEYISMIFSGEGNGTFKTVYSSGGFSVSEPFTYSVNNDGTFFVNLNFYGQEGTLHGIVSSDGESFTMWPFSVGFKKSSGKSNASLSGEYIMSAYLTNEENESSTKYVSLNFTGAGLGTFQIIHSSVGDSGTIGSLTYSVKDDGTFFLTFSDNIADSEQPGIVSSDGEMFTMVGIDSSEFGIYAGIKKSSGMSNAILSGEYIMIQYLEEEDTSTEYFLVTCDGVGNGTAEMVYSSCGDSGTFPFTYSVNDDGTGFFMVTDGESVTKLPFIVNYDGKKIIMVASSSSGFGIYFGIAKSDFTVGIPEHSIELPDYYALKQNYPNPFNPFTTIRYNLPKATKVTLKIYNIHGQEIRTLVNKNQISGYKSVTWDGKNNFGQNISSGIYAYRLQIQDFIETRKLLLIR